MGMKSLFIGLCIIAGAGFLAHPVQAASAVVINEVSIHPANGNDWVELYNSSSSEIDISGWQLKDTGASPIKLLSGTISANGYFVLDAGNRLNNSGDTITLIDTTSAVQDTFPYASDPGVDVTIGRSPDGSGNFETLINATKGSANSGHQIIPPATSPSPSASSHVIGGTTVATTGISLSEYLPAPQTNEDEWVELYNSADTEAYIAGWKIDDADGGSSPFTLPDEGNSSFIPPRSYKVIVLASARLNNSGDTIRLLKPDGSVAEQTSYTEAQSGVAYAKNNSGQWQETTTLTPGSENVISAALPKATATSTPKASSTNQPIGTIKPNASIGSLGANSSGILGQNISLYNGSASTVNDVLPELMKEATGSGYISASRSAMVKSSIKNGHNMKEYIISAILLACIACGYGIYRYKIKAN